MQAPESAKPQTSLATYKITLTCGAFTIISGPLTLEQHVRSRAELKDIASIEVVSYGEDKPKA